MKTIFSKVTLQKKQIGILAVFIFSSSVGEMLLPSLLEQPVYQHGVDGIDAKG